MKHTTVRIREETHRLLKELARAERRPMLVILEAALEAYRRQSFLVSVNAAYAALREDPDAASELEAELRDWDRVLGDGLREDEGWGDDGGPVSTDRRSRR
jgi:predicted transcriptional regulator